MADYLDKMLLPGEKVIARGGKHVLTYLHGLFFVFIAIFFIGLSMNLQNEYGFHKVMFSFRGISITVKNITYVLYTLSIILFIYGIHSFFLVSTWSSYVVTNRRFIRKFGLATRTISEMNLHNVIRVEINQPIMGKIFNYGDITVYEHSGENIHMRMIESPYALQRYVTVIMKSKRISPQPSNKPRQVVQKTKK